MKPLLKKLNVLIMPAGQSLRQLRSTSAGTRPAST